MATMTGAPTAMARERFWMIGALLMTAVIVAGFSMALAMGRSSFGAPLPVHIHALVFFGWVVLYLTQNLLAGTGSLAMHRRLGWLAVGWIPAMIAMGTFITLYDVRAAHAPFFFQPAYFLILDPLTVYTFAGLAVAAILHRRRTQWHRRLMFCGMAILCEPGIGRLLPMPFLIPYAGEACFVAVLLFPIAGVIRDLRASGRVHPAWGWGIGAIVTAQLAINAITFSPVGAAIYRVATAGSPGAAVAPLAFGRVPPRR